MVMLEGTVLLDDSAWMHSAIPRRRSVVDICMAWTGRECGAGF